MKARMSDVFGSNTIIVDRVDSGSRESEVPISPIPVRVPIAGVRNPINTKAAAAITTKPTTQSKIIGCALLLRRTPP